VHYISVKRSLEIDVHSFSELLTQNSFYGCLSFKGWKWKIITTTCNSHRRINRIL